MQLLSISNMSSYRTIISVPPIADSLTQFRLQRMNLTRLLVKTMVAMVAIAFIGLLVFVCHRLFAIDGKATAYEGIV